jgi:hypothetical protein
VISFRAAYYFAKRGEVIAVGRGIDSTLQSVGFLARIKLDGDFKIALNEVQISVLDFKAHCRFFDKPRITADDLVILMQDNATPNSHLEALEIDTVKKVTKVTKVLQ